MNEEIKAHVVKYRDRKNLMMRYLDPFTGKHVARTTRTADSRCAMKEAAKWEEQLQSGRYQKPTLMTWDAFRDYYSTHALPGLAKRTAMTYESTLNVFEGRCNPRRLADVTTARVTAFVTGMRTDSAAEATIAHHLRHLKASMRWANQQGLLLTLPQFTMPKRAKGTKVMRGRPNTMEKFERMLIAVPKAIEARPTTVHGVDVVSPLRFYLRGLSLSGLRLSESLTLRWDDGPDSIVVDFSGRRPMFRIPAEVDKGNKDRMLPMAPEFAELLLDVPERNRRGRVFKLLTPTGHALSAACDVSKVGTKIGRAANVVVDERHKGGKILRKFGSAHDLRRAFGQRWATRVMPPVLKELMRHESVETTMKYYVGQNAEATADVLLSSISNIQGNSETNFRNRMHVHSQRPEKQVKSK